MEETRIVSMMSHLAVYSVSYMWASFRLESETQVCEHCFACLMLDIRRIPW